MSIEQAKERLKSIVDFYKLNDENNYDYSDDVLISMKLVLEEIERLNNIINEFDKWLEEQENNSTYPSMIFIGSARHKLQELKGSDKE